jgi:GR25 family glycosyltransferase involved in LPS biosynthesis
MKIPDFFQKGFYINLDIRPERKNQFLKNMGEVGLENFFERFSAFYWKDEIDYKYYDAHQACARSHITLVRNCLEQNLERVLILEDDVFFAEDGLKHIENSLDTLSKIDKWDVIYLGAMIRDDELNMVGKNLLKQKRMLTTHAIGLSKSGLEKLSKFIWEGGATIDGWLQNQEHNDYYVTYPIGLVQYHGPSDCNSFGYSAPVEDYYRGYKNPFKNRPLI